MRLSRALFYFLRPSVVFLEVPSVSIQLENPLNKPFPEHYLVVSGRLICRKPGGPSSQAGLVVGRAPGGDNFPVPDSPIAD